MDRHPGGQFSETDTQVDKTEAVEKDLMEKYTGLYKIEKWNSKRMGDLVLTSEK